jgi:GDP-4-dehydro-6-deoxy-D-mannose reductase
VWLAGLGPRPTTPAILSAAEWDGLRWVTADVRSDSDVAALCTAARPDLVFHLAGLSYIPDAEKAPVATYEINVLGAVRLISAVCALRGDALMLVVGSGTQYGPHADDEMPLGEAAEQRPTNIYAASKAAQEIAALQMARTSGVRVICTRSFSHSGRGHAGAFLLPSLVRRIRDLSPGDPLRTGNDVVRDYLHVEDVVAAYLALAERGRPGQVYNVASGVGLRVSDLAREALSRSGVQAKVIGDPALRRPADIPVLIGSPAKLIAETGWRPVRSYTDILDDLLAEPAGSA